METEGAMSKHNNTNSDHYKVAGREHQGDDVHHDRERQTFSGAEAHAQDSSSQRPHIPNQELASQTKAGSGDTESQGREGAADAQNISGTWEVEPTLSDDEGFTG
jgi:hypothetical protein